MKVEDLHLTVLIVLDDTIDTVWQIIFFKPTIGERWLTKSDQIGWKYIKRKRVELEEPSIREKDR